MFWKVVCKISDSWNKKLRAAVKICGNLGLLRSVKCGVSREGKLQSLEPVYDLSLLPQSGIMAGAAAPVFLPPHRTFRDPYFSSRDSAPCQV